MLLLRLAFAAATFPAAWAIQCSITVDPVTGSDAALRAVDTPYRSLAAARDAVRALPRPLPVGGVVVCVSAGRYSEPLILEGERDSGDAEDRRIAWVGTGGGAVSSSGWPRSELTAGVRVAFTPGAAGVWTASLPAVGVTDFGTWTPHGFLFPSPMGGCPAAPLELFSDGAAPGGPGAVGFGEPMVVARWPNVANASEPYSEWTAEESWTRAAFVRDVELQDSALFTSRDVPFANWTASIAQGNVFFTGFPFWEWADASLPVRAFNASNHLLSLEHGLIPQNVSYSAKYFAQNAVEALDAPGEYWLDPVSGLLHFIPPKGVSTSPLVGWVSNATANASLISLAAVAHVTLANLAVSFSRERGIVVASSSDVVLLNMTVLGMGSGGISVTGSNSTVVAGATVVGSGGAAVDTWGGGNRASLTSSGVVVVDTTVRHFGRRCLSYAPGISVGSVGGVVAHNDVSGGPHVGANTVTNDGLFEFNVVHETVLAACDMAAFYSGAADFSVWNTTVRYNLFYKNGYAAAGCNDRSGNDLADIYFDEAQSGVAVYANVHYSPVPPYNFSYLARRRMIYAHLINGGTHVTATNSLILDANISFTQSIHALSSSYFPTVCDPAGSHLSGMHAVQWNSGVYAARYPELAALQGACDASAAACAGDPSCPAAPYGGAFTNSVNVNVSVVTQLGENSTVFDPQHFNFSGLWEGLDPSFAAGSPAAARATLNFQLTDDSPIYTAVPGFRKIPMECFGPFACSGASTPYPRAAHIALQLPACQPGQCGV